MTWMTTASGTDHGLSRCMLLQAEYHLNDIAHAGAQINRYNGHAKRPMSINEHQLLCADIAEHLSPARGKGKAPKAKAEAAPKTTPAQAQAAIAAALRAAEDQNQAPTAQGNEAPPDPSVGDAPAHGGEGGSGARDGAAVEAAKPLKEGATVRVRPHDAGPKNAPYIGQTGTLRYLVGQRRDTWRVAFPAGVVGKKETVESFNVAHLEVVA